MTARVIRAEEVQPFEAGVLRVTDLIFDDENLSVAKVEVAGRNRGTRNLKSVAAYYVVSGEGRFILNGVRHEVSAGDLVYIPKGEPYRSDGHMALLAINTPPFDQQAIESTD